MQRGTRQWWPREPRWMRRGGKHDGFCMQMGDRLPASGTQERKLGHYFILYYKLAQEKIHEQQYGIDPDYIITTTLLNPGRKRNPSQCLLCAARLHDDEDDEKDRNDAEIEKERGRIESFLLSAFGLYRDFREGELNDCCIVSLSLPLARSRNFRQQAGSFVVHSIRSQWMISPYCRSSAITRRKAMTRQSALHWPVGP